MFDQQVAFYYFSNAKDESCMNKLCVVGATVAPYAIDPDHKETNYYFGIYENDKGTSNLINADPFVKEENKYILKDFEPTFISPVAAIINPQSILDETSKQDNIPEEVYQKEKLLHDELAKSRAYIKNAELTKKQTDKMQDEMNKLMKDINRLHDKVLRQERISLIRDKEEEVYGRSFYSKLKDVS